MSRFNQSQKRHHRADSRQQPDRRHGNLTRGPGRRSSVVRSIARGVNRITYIGDGAIRIINSPTRATSTRRRIVDRSQATEWDVRQKDIQRAQILPQARRPVPHAVAPVAAAGRAVVTAGALRCGAYGGLLQDEVDALVRGPGGDAVGLRDVAGVSDVDGLGEGPGRRVVG